MFPLKIGFKSLLDIWDFNFEKTPSEINIKLSNMEMKILLNNSKRPPKIKNKILIKKDKLSSEIIPSFTKKIFYTISKSE